MRRRYPALALSFLLGSCAASDDNTLSTPVPPTGEPIAAEATPTPTPTPKPEVEVAAAATVRIATPSIASVLLTQDCPDPRTQSKVGSQKPKASVGFAPSSPDPGASRKDRARRKGVGSFKQPCSQSMLQLSFTGQEGKSSTATVKNVRLQSVDGKDLGGLETRMPTIWKESGYEVWDGTLKPGANHKTSYKLSVPNWSDVEATLGGSSYGRMYTLEVDVEIDGQSTTLTSPQFERGRSQIMRT